MKVINQGNLEGIGKTAPTVTNPRSQGGRDEMIVGVRVLNPINLKENIGVKGGVKVQNLINLKERREMIGAKVLNLENLDEKRKMMTLATFLNSRKEVKVKKSKKRSLFRVQILMSQTPNLCILILQIIEKFVV